MRHGNLSSGFAPIIAFDIDVIVRNKKKGHFDSIKSVFHSDEQQFMQSFDRTRAYIINSLWRNYSFRIFIISPLGYDDYQRIDGLLSSVELYYNRLVMYGGDIPSLRKVIELEYTYFFSANRELIGKISHDRAVMLDDLPFVLPLSGRR